MRYLKSYKLFESIDIENDRLYSDINDICQELKDNGLMVRVQISECAVISNMLCDEVVTIWTNVISSNVRINRIDEVIEYGKVKETYDRLIDYLSTKGYDNYKLKRFNFGIQNFAGSVYLDFDGDENQKSESFKIEFYKSVDHIIESKSDVFNDFLESKKEVSKLKFNKQPRKKGAKTDIYNVVKNGTTIGQVKWYSRLRGYGFLPPTGDESEVKEFVKEVSRLRREENKKNKK
jgi:hypothetical protein